MPATQRTCEVPGCAVEIPRGILMCKPHWYTVPGATRRKVNAAWRAYSAALKSETRSAEALLAALRAYRAARAEAVAAVQAAAP